MHKYCVCVHFHDHIENVLTESYLMAWEVYRMVEKIYPKEATIDIIDGNTGEVFQSNSADF